jgi:hypothetical protein
MVHVEMSVAIPLIAGALMEGRKFRSRKGPVFKWNNDELVMLQYSK